MNFSVQSAKWLIFCSVFVLFTKPNVSHQIFDRYATAFVANTWVDPSCERAQCSLQSEKYCWGTFCNIFLTVTYTAQARGSHLYCPRCSLLRFVGWCVAPSPRNAARRTATQDRMPHLKALLLFFRKVCLRQLQGDSDSCKAKNRCIAVGAARGAQHASCAVTVKCTSHIRDVPLLAEADGGH